MTPRTLALAAKPLVPCSSSTEEMLPAVLTDFLFFFCGFCVQSLQRLIAALIFGVYISPLNREAFYIRDKFDDDKTDKQQQQERKAG